MPKSLSPASSTSFTSAPLAHRDGGHAQAQRSAVFEQLRALKTQSVFRLVVGGPKVRSGFANAICEHAVQHKLLVAKASLDHRHTLYGPASSNIFRSITLGLSTAKRTGVAALRELADEFAGRHDWPSSSSACTGYLTGVLEPLAHCVGGIDFAKALHGYACDSGQLSENERQAKFDSLLHALRISNIEVSSRVRSARTALKFFDGLEMLIEFARLAGRPGVVLLLDGLDEFCGTDIEQVRASNLMGLKVLVNRTASGGPGLAVLAFGSPALLSSEDAGLLSDPSLRVMVQENPFAQGGLVDHYQPVIRLRCSA